MDLNSLDRALMRGKMKWGDYMYYYDILMNKRRTPEERAELEKKKKNAAAAATASMLETAKGINLERKKKMHFNVKTKTLKRIAKLCKWECDGEKCWAHDKKMCPYIHKNEPGWNEKHAEKKGGKRRLTRRKRSRSN